MRGGGGQQITNRRSIANGDVPAKQLFGGSLTLRDYDGQVGGGYGTGTSLEQNDESRYA